MTGNSPAHRRAAVPESRHPQLGAAPATPDQLAGAWGEDEGLRAALAEAAMIVADPGMNQRRNRPNRSH